MSFLFLQYFLVKQNLQKCHSCQVLQGSCSLHQSNTLLWLTVREIVFIIDLIRYLYKTKDVTLTYIWNLTHFYLFYHFLGMEVSHSTTTDCHSHFERVRTDCALKKKRVPPATFHVCVPSLSANGTNIFTLYIFKNISIIHIPIF